MADGVLKQLLTEVRSWRASVGSTPRRVLLAAKGQDKERPDPTPMAIPIGYEAPATMEQLIQMYVRREVSAAAADQGFGTFEEEDDFDEEDPSDLPLSGFEVTEYRMEDEMASPDASPPPESPQEDFNPEDPASGTPDSGVSPGEGEEPPAA